MCLHNDTEIRITHEIGPIFRINQLNASDLRIFLETSQEKRISTLWNSGHLHSLCCCCSPFYFECFNFIIIQINAVQIISSRWRDKHKDEYKNRFRLGFEAKATRDWRFTFSTISLLNNRPEKKLIENYPWAFPYIPKGILSILDNRSRNKNSQ